jgi:inosine-uridine nucleoside N-ribohydrolase
MSDTRRKLVIDCDGGVEDAEALMLALSCSETVNVVAVTCVGGGFGCTGVSWTSGALQGSEGSDQICFNVLRVLRICEQQQVS